MMVFEFPQAIELGVADTVTDGVADTSVAILKIEISIKIKNKFLKP